MMIRVTRTVPAKNRRPTPDRFPFNRPQDGGGADSLKELKPHQHDGDGDDENRRELQRNSPAIAKALASTVAAVTLFTMTLRPTGWR